MSEFWRTAASSGGELNVEDLRRTMQAVKDAPPRRCPHVVSPKYRDNMRDREAKGQPVYCPWCGSQVRT
jgi:hypothetical protein